MDEVAPVAEGQRARVFAGTDQHEHQTERAFTRQEPLTGPG